MFWNYAPICDAFRGIQYNYILNRKGKVNQVADERN